MNSIKANTRRQSGAADQNNQHENLTLISNIFNPWLAKWRYSHGHLSHRGFIELTEAHPNWNWDSKCWLADVGSCDE